MENINIYTAMTFTAMLVLLAAVIFVWLKLGEVSGSYNPFFG